MPNQSFKVDDQRGGFRSGFGVARIRISDLCGLLWVNISFFYSGDDFGVCGL